MNLNETSIAAVLNANRTPLHACQDMADYLETVHKGFSRVNFIKAATKGLRKDVQRSAAELQRWADA